MASRLLSNHGRSTSTKFGNQSSNSNSFFPSRKRVYIDDEAQESRKLDDLDEIDDIDSGEESSEEQDGELEDDALNELIERVETTLAELENNPNSLLVRSQTKYYMLKYEILAKAHPEQAKKVEDIFLDNSPILKVKKEETGVHNNKDK